VLRKAQTVLTRRRRRSSLFRRSLVLAATLIFAIGSVAIREALSIDVVRINEATLPLSTAERWADAYRKRWLAQEISMLVDGRVYRKTREELGGRLQIEELQAAMARVAGERSASDDEAVYWSPEVDHNELLASIFQLREAITPLDPEGNPPPGTKTLDLHGALKIIKQALPTSSLLVTLPTRWPILKSIAGGARPGTFSQLLAGHTSPYRKAHRSWSRGHNIEQAAKALDGVIIEPHGELSFNEIVGDRSFQRGFMPANEIARGRVVDGIGGGVCQVATALHAAALKSGFEVLEHYVHSKRPRYAARGFDSAVAWGLKDLRIRSPYPDYVRIRGEASSGELLIELWSGQRPPRVEITTNIEAGALNTKDQLLIIERTRTVLWPDGARTDTKMLRYPAEPKK